MGIGFLMIVPVLFWLFIVMLIIAVSKPKRRPQQNYRKDSAPQRYQHTARKSFDRPKMQEGLFDIKLGKSGGKKADKKNTMFGNTGFDDYSAIGRKKDYVTGYDKKYSKDNMWSRHSSAMQYSHTYDGHEPWDDCLPKEKDPWDKDFYT